VIHLPQPVEEKVSIKPVLPQEGTAEETVRDIAKDGKKEKGAFGASSKPGLDRPHG